MKRGFGLGGMAWAAATGLVLAMVAGSLALSACGRLKDDSTRKEPQPAPAAAPALDTSPAPADHAAAPADTAVPAKTAAPEAAAISPADTAVPTDTSAPADTAAALDRPPYPAESSDTGSDIDTDPEG